MVILNCCLLLFTSQTSRELVAAPRPALFTPGFVRGVAAVTVCRQVHLFTVPGRLTGLRFRGFAGAAEANLKLDCCLGSLAPPLPARQRRAGGAHGVERLDT